MSSFTQSRYITGLKAGADLSAQANLHCAVKLDASGDVVLCGAGELGLGFLMNLPGLGEAAEVAGIGGGALGISAATLGEGAELAADANGHLVAAVATGTREPCSGGRSMPGRVILALSARRPGARPTFRRSDQRRRDALAHQCAWA